MAQAIENVSGDSMDTLSHVLLWTYRASKVNEAVGAGFNANQAVEAALGRIEFRLGARR